MFPSHDPNLRSMIGKEIRLYEYNDQIRRISYKTDNRHGAVVAMTRDPQTKDGFNPSLGIIDEYHEAKNDKLLNVIESGQGARAEPLLVVITTAGFNKDGVCYSKIRKVSVDILEGRIEDDSHLALIYELDKGDDWKDEDTWIKSNPMLPYMETILPKLQKRKLQAMNEGGSKQVDFETKNLNRWTDAAEVWIPHEFIMLNDHDTKDLEGHKCYAGFDLAKSTDLNAFCLFLPDRD